MSKYWDDLVWYCQREINFRHFKKIKQYFFEKYKRFDGVVGSYITFRFIDGGNNGQA